MAISNTWLLQWGKSVTSGSGASTTEFPMAFTNIPSVVTANSEENVNTRLSANVHGITTVAFKAHVKDTNFYKNAFDYLACGY